MYNILDIFKYYHNILTTTTTKMYVKHEKCGYSWQCKSTKMYIGCPNCLLKFKNPNYDKNLILKNLLNI